MSNKTETKKIDKLTPEQEEFAKKLADEWILRALGGDTSIDEKAMTESINWIYSKIDKAPPTIQIFDSPKAMIEAGQKLNSSVTAGDGFGLGYDSSWVAFYDFFDKIGLLENEDFRKYRAFLLSGVWDTLFFESVAYVCRRMKITKKDPEGRMHCQDGPAVAFNDGFSVYAWHGTRVPADWIMKKDEVDPSIALTWENIEQRRALAEIIGWARIIEKLDVKVIDEDKDPQIGSLLQAKMPDGSLEMFLKVVCGTGRTFVLPVPNDSKTAKAANASTYGLTPDEFNVEVRT